VQCIGFETITRQLLTLLDGDRKRLGLTWNQVALWGYSAGALMAGWLCLQLREACAGMVLLHGLAPDARLPRPPSFEGPRPPALVLAGECDVQIPPRAVELAVQALEKHGFSDITHHVEPEQGHGPSDHEFRLMQDICALDLAVRCFEHRDRAREQPPAGPCARTWGDAEPRGGGPVPVLLC